MPKSVCRSITCNTFILVTLYVTGFFIQKVLTKLLKLEYTRLVDSWPLGFICCLNFDLKREAQWPITRPSASYLVPWRDRGSNPGKGQINYLDKIRVIVTFEFIYSCSSFLLETKRYV